MYPSKTTVSFLQKGQTPESSKSDQYDPDLTNLSACCFPSCPRQPFSLVSSVASVFQGFFKKLFSWEAAMASCHGVYFLSLSALFHSTVRQEHIFSQFLRTQCPREGPCEKPHVERWVRVWFEEFYDTADWVLLSTKTQLPDPFLPAPHPGLFEVFLLLCCLADSIMLE